MSLGFEPICQLCGALIGDAAKHQAFHDDLAVVSAMSMLANPETRDQVTDEAAAALEVIVERIKARTPQNPPEEAP